MEIKNYKKVRQNMDAFLDNMSYALSMANILELLFEDEQNISHIDIISLSKVLSKHLKLIKHNISDIRRDILGL